MIDGIRIIEKGKFSCANPLPLWHRGYWFGKRIRMEITLNRAWMTYFHDNTKANQDIQKIIGYTLDPFKSGIIRLGCNTGYPNFNGFDLSLYGYFTKNFQRFTNKGSGKFPLGKINTAFPFVVEHQLTKLGHPYFFVQQNNIKVAEKVFSEIAYSPSSLGGYNMSPYYEADIYGAPEQLTANIKFTQLSLHDI